MSTETFLEITGGKTLSGGVVSIAGSSNQVTKCIIAALMTDEDVIIKNVPEVDERHRIEELFTYLGGTIEQLESDVIRLNASTVDKTTLDKAHSQRNRISILCAGPLLYRFGRVTLHGELGGDRIGKRPVNFHIDALAQMGAKVEFENGVFHLTLGPEGLQGAHIKLPYPSVMTTENILITASRAKGRTIIENAAIEPEVIELTKMLQKMGADITWDSHRSFIIQGVEKLSGCEHDCMFDRNQAVSFAVAALATGGDVLLRNVTHDPVYSFLNFVQRMGGYFKFVKEGLFIKGCRPETLKGTHIEVDVHPGFMTDWQQPFMVLFTQASGISVLHETVFEERLQYTDYLNHMGASITVSSKCLGEVPCRYRNSNHIHSAIIQGPTPLYGRNFRLPTDIRAGMCLVIAALVARGKTRLANIHEIQRKYDNLVPKLQAMGADIRIQEGIFTADGP
jgi:UDP-N-acetylglucosamine 1-carboxyvinyltransferase